MSGQASAEPAPPPASTAAGPDEGQHHAFISYARRPADQAFVDELCRELEARGKRVWVDRSDIPPGADWLARITKGIQGASSLVFVLTPHSASSTVCQEELSIALEQNKRIIPILRQRVDPDQLPPALARLNWISFTDDDDRDEALGKVFEAIEMDLDWRDAHTRLTVRTHEWLDSGRDSSFLLRGRDLRAAEAWYAGREGHRESPTAGQVDYIISSRRNAARRQRVLLGAVSVSLAVAVALAIFALVQRSEARHQADLALSRQLAAQAVGAGSSDVRLQSLLGLEAFSREPTAQARSAVVGAVEQPLIATMPGGPRIASPAIPDEVESIAYSPDGRIVAVGAKYGVELWDARTHKSLAHPFATNVQVNGVAFSGDGRLLAVGGSELVTTRAAGRKVEHVLGFIAVYRVATRTEAYPSLQPDAPVADVAFSPSGGQVAFVTSNATAFGVSVSTVYLWNLGAHDYVPQNLPEKSGDGDGALRVRFNRAGTELAVSGGTEVANGENGFINVYRVRPLLGGAETFSSLESFHVTGSEVDAIAFAPAGTTLAAGDGQGKAHLYDTATNQELSTFTVGSGVDSIAFSPDGATIATGDESGAVRLWGSAAPYAQVGQAMEDGSVVYGLAFAPNGRTLWTGGADGGLFVWDASGGPSVDRTLAAGMKGQNMLQLGLSGDGDELATFTFKASTQTGTASAWNIGTARRIGMRVPTSATAIATSVDAPAPVSAVAVNRLGTTVALGLVDGDVLLENATLRRAVTLPQDDGTAVADLAFSADGRRLVVGRYDGTTSLWNVPARRRIGVLRFLPSARPTGGVTAVAINPAGTTVAVSTEMGGTELFEAKHPSAHPRPLRTNESIYSLAFTPDGSTLLAGDISGDVELLDPATTAQTGTLPGDGNTVDVVAVSPDGEIAATGDDIGVVRLWDLSTSQPLGVPVPAGAGIIGAAFTARTDQLVTADSDGDVVIWPSLVLSQSPAAFATDLCPRLSMNLTAAQWRQQLPGEPYHLTCPGLPDHWPAPATQAG